MKQDIWKQFGLTKPPKPRYSGLQGVLWYVISRYVRKSEFIQYDGYCVDGCGRRVEDWHLADCGHFRSSKHVNTRFVRENLGLQRKDCNNPKWTPDASYGFGVTIDKRYGEGTAKRLFELSNQPGKEMNKAQLTEQIHKYLALYNELP